MTTTQSGVLSVDSSSVPLLAGEDDSYGGFIIDPICLPPDAASFSLRLKASLDHWKSQSKKGIWLKLPLQNSNLVHCAVVEGFIYHHAEPDYVMLTKWIADIPSTLPANASHIVGVGALVINDQREILVVQERTGPTQGSGVWKLPTGVIHQGEDIFSGVKREVFEETGVEADLTEVVGFREAHEQAFGKSDLFILCILQPTSAQITTQETEIAAAKWMPLDEFGAQPFNATSTMLTRMVEIATASIEGQYRGFSPELLRFGFRSKGSYFYHNLNDIKKYLSSSRRKV